MPTRGGPGTHAAADILRLLGNVHEMSVAPLFVGGEVGEGVREIQTQLSGGKLQVTPRIVGDSSVVDAIVREARDVNLLVLGCTEEMRTADSTFGHVVDDVIPRTSCGVLVVRGARGQDRDEAAKRDIVVGVTGATHSRRAAELAVLTARASGATIHLVHVVSPPPEGLVWTSAFRQRSQEASLDLVEEVSMLGDAYDITVRTHVREDMHAGQAIASVAEEVGAEMIVLGGHRRSAVRIFLGPTISWVVDHARCTVAMLIT
jgi:nucleotide-binding universal stress UspA family protein